MKINQFKEWAGKINFSLLNWSRRGAAIGNALWGGTFVRDLVNSLNIKQEEVEDYHLTMVGLDHDPSGKVYEISIPMSSVMDKKADVMLAYEMNGETLPRDHGYPIRMLCPGMTGSRNLKWLGKIGIKKTESESNWHKKDYKTVYNSS